MSRNFVVLDKKEQLSKLKFLFTLLDDADKQLNSLFVFDNSVSFKNIVPDPSLGVQVGSLGSYYVSSLKIIGFKTNPENIHQVILVSEDWLGKKHDVFITTSLFMDVFKTVVSEEFFEKPRFIRALFFQEFGETFKHIIYFDEIDENNLLKDSLIAYVRFRINVKKLPRELSYTQPKGIYKEDNIFTYFNPELDWQIYKEKESNQTGMLLPAKIKAIWKINSYFEYNPNLKSLYSSKSDLSENLLSVKILEHNPVGIHKLSLRDLISRLTYYSMNKYVLIFCTHCKKFKERIKAGNLPAACPICEAKTLVRLLKDEDSHLFSLSKRNQDQEKRFDYYDRLSSLYISFGKYLYLAINATHKGINHCVNLLNLIRNNLNTNEFFKKVYEIQKEGTLEYQKYIQFEEDIEEISV